MKRPLITFIIIAELLLVVGALTLHFICKPVTDEWVHITDASEMQETLSDIPIQSCDCYQYIKDYSLGGFAYSLALSGRLTVPAEYYKKITSQYDDWKKPDSIFSSEYSQPCNYAEYMDAYSCDLFRDFAESGNFVISEQFNRDCGMIILFSTDTTDLYIYSYSAR